MPNEQYFDLFADTHLRQELHNKAVGILKCSQSADDAVQDTYIKMLNYKKEIPTKGQWKAICKNAIPWAAIDILRKNKVIKKTLDAYFSNEIGKTSINPYKRLEDKEKIEEIQRIITQNSDECGQKMMWLRAKGYKYEDIAEELGISVGSATGKVARIRKKMKSAMEKKAYMQAKYQEIEQLLHKYWEAQTNIEEEKKLETFFASQSVPSHLTKFISIFQHSKNIRDKANRKRVGKLLGICSLIPVFLFVAYFLYAFIEGVGQSPQDTLQANLALQEEDKPLSSQKNHSTNMVKFLPCSTIDKKKEKPYTCRLDIKQKNILIIGNVFSLSPQVEVIEI